MQPITIITDKDIIEFCRKEGLVYLHSLSLYEVPNNIEELKEYYKDNNRIEIDDKSFKNSCHIWILDNLGELKLSFVIEENSIECITLDTKIKSIADLCLIIDKILGDK